MGYQSGRMAADLLWISLSFALLCGCLALMIATLWRHRSATMRRDKLQYYTKMGRAVTGISYNPSGCHIVDPWVSFRTSTFRLERRRHASREAATLRVLAACRDHAPFVQAGVYKLGPDTRSWVDKATIDLLVWAATEAAAEVTKAKMGGPFRSAVAAAPASDAANVIFGKGGVFTAKRDIAPDKELLVSSYGKGFWTQGAFLSKGALVGHYIRLSDGHGAEELGKVTAFNRIDGLHTIQVAGSERRELLSSSTVRRVGLTVQWKLVTRSK